LDLGVLLFFGFMFEAIGGRSKRWKVSSNTPCRREQVGKSAKMACFGTDRPHSPPHVQLITMSWAYRILFPPLLLLALPYYLWRMLRRGGYRHGFSQRLGFFPKIGPKVTGKRRIWVQAVSVGEIEAIGPFLRQLKDSGTTEVILTTTTSTGYALAQSRYADVAKAIGIFPTDLWPCSALAWRRIQPDQVILVEGELWPEHLAQANARGIPAMLINGRISDKSFARHQRFRRISTSLLRRFQMICASSEEDARRFRELGVEPHLTGNIKFDVASEAPPSNEERQQLRESLGFGQDPKTIILLGSSTWAGEEQLLLDCVRQLRTHADVRLLLVPRHSERRKDVCVEIVATGLAWHQRSTQAPAPAGTIVHLADTTGELRRLTRAADIAFCGKSLSPHEGGQTPVECAAAGVALLYGPRMTNFRDICQGLERAGAATRLEQAADLFSALEKLVREPARAMAMGQHGLAWHQSNRGATARTVALVLNLR
jgi:3-deoxy-D-manno-octulosonic-acid transferase